MRNITTAQALAVLGLQGFDASDSHDPFAGYAPPSYETPRLGADGIELLGQDSLELLGQDDMMGADALELLGNDAGNVMSLLGADALELLGADRRRRRTQLHPTAQAIVRSARIQKELFLPVPATSLPAATPTQIINVQPQLTCQINQLVIPSNVGPFFMVNDVIIGTRSQFAAPGAISGVGLSEVQTGNLKGDTATLGTIISVSVTNISGVDKVLQGAYFRVRALVQ